MNDKQEFKCSKITTSSGFTPLMHLIMNNSIEDVKEYLNYKDQLEEINKQNDKGWTALMLACRNSKIIPDGIEKVKLLLNRSDVNINKQEDDGWTALMMACGSSNEDSSLDTVKELLSHSDIDINKQDKRGYTALMIACLYSNTNSSLDTIKLLYQCKYHFLDIYLENKQGVTALHYCLINLDKEMKSNIDTFKFLLDKGADINIKYRGQDLIDLIFSHKVLPIFYNEIYDTLINKGFVINDHNLNHMKFKSIVMENKSKLFENKSKNLEYKLNIYPILIQRFNHDLISEIFKFL